LAEQQNIMVIDATGLLAGRIGTKVARAALHGATIKIINAEKAAISGKKGHIIEAWKRKVNMGVPRKGPFVYRQPDRFLRRIIRGMLPYKQPRGREAYARIMCYIGVPTDLKDAKTMTFADISVDKLPTTRYMTIGMLCKELGGNWNE